MTDAVRYVDVRAADVPDGDDWLGPDERAVLAGLRFSRRRADWRLGRFAAKRLLRELTGAWPEFERRGWGIVAVSVDRVEGAAQTTAAYDIPFPLLSDPDLSFHRAFAVVQHADEAEVARLKGFGLDIERASGRTHHEFAIPSIFAIDADGVVRWAHADPDYKARPSPAQVLAAIDALPPASE